MTKLKTAVVAVTLTLGFNVEPALAGGHTACNCWEGDYICTIEDPNHNVLGVIVLHDTGC